MKFLEKFIGFGLAAITALGLTANIAFAENKETLVINTIRVSDILKDSDKINLDSFVKDKVFDKCYGNQLDGVSKTIYDTLVANIENSKNGTESIGNKKYLENLDIFLPEQEYLKDYNYVEFDIDTKDEIVKDDFINVKCAIMAFDYDHPEVFWLNFDNIMYLQLAVDNKFYLSFVPFNPDYDVDNYYCYKENFEYAYSSKADVDKEERKLRETCDYVHNQVKNRTDYEKIEYINNFLVERNEYNRILIEKNKIENPIKRDEEIAKLDSRLWKATSALIYGSTDLDNRINPVCEGYSRAFKILCDNENIECVLVSGTEESGGPHMWNYVKLNDKWYAVDCTFNDPTLNWSPSKEQLEKIKKYYLLIGEDSLVKGWQIDQNNNSDTHNPETSDVLYKGIEYLSYPVLEKNDYLVPGDVNKDKNVDFDDVSELLNSVLNSNVSDYQKTVAHFDKSKESVTATDVAILIERILKNRK